MTIAHARTPPWVQSRAAEYSRWRHRCLTIGVERGGGGGGGGQCLDHNMFHYKKFSVIYMHDFAAAIREHNIYKIPQTKEPAPKHCQNPG